MSSFRRTARARALRFEQLEGRMLLATIVVNDTADLEDYDLEDGICSATFDVQTVGEDTIIVPNNDCTLRAAIENANGQLGLDTITFGVAAGTVIGVAEPILIEDPITIDAPAGKIAIQGTDSDLLGLVLSGDADGSIIRNLVINGFNEGLVIVADNCLVVGSHFGVNLAGTAAVGNRIGLTVAGNNNTIGGPTAADRNIISGNTIVGVVLGALGGNSSDGQNNHVFGNLIGTDITGNITIGNGVGQLGNAGQGVRIFSGSNHIVGGSGALGNVISGNRIGVVIDAAATANLILGNKIGTNLAGTAALGNIEAMQVFGPNNIIGGDLPGGTVEIVGNVISGSIGDAPASIFGAGVQLIGVVATGNVIQGNKIGTDVTGTIKIANKSDGVDIIAGASNNTVGGTAAGARNIISGNDGDGVTIFSNQPTGSNNNVVLGNYIGVDASGFVALGNKFRGVHIDSNASGNVIGGDTPEKRNVISGNMSDGVIIALAGATGNKVFGNFIGTDSDGTLDLPNTRHGVHILNASQNEIGGALPTERNVISGNLLSGVRVFGTDSFGNRISGNYIGTTHTGDAPLGNVQSGVLIEDARDNYIGVDFASPSLGNTISANTDGVLIKGLSATDNIVAGNFIGTDALGGTGLTPTTFPIGNLQNGILIDGATDNFIGPGLVPMAGCDEQVVNEINVISNNLKSGIEILGDTATGNNIRCNSIFANAGLGIDLKDDGVSPNDMTDADVGPNELQNFPVISLIEQIESTIRVGGTLHSKASTTYRIDFYATEVSEATAIEYALQGQRYLGTQTIMTDSTGHEHFEVVLPELIGNEVITSTATDLAGNTSEFGPFTADVKGKGSFQARTPVLLLHGFFGSFANEVPGNTGDDDLYRDWLLRVGIEPSGLQIDPLIKVYSDQIKSLQRAGYKLGEDLFVANYDWRLNLAPITSDQIQHDGQITGVTGASLADNTFNYGLDYLGYWLKQAAESWYAKYQQPLANVHIIAHSMGGLLARSYIQSTAYGDTFTSAAAGRDLPLPTVSSLTMLGVPNQGGAGPWNGWQDNFFATAANAYVLSKVINHAWQKLLDGSTISVGTNTLLTASTFDGFDALQKKIEFVRRYTPGLGNLLPDFSGFAVDFDPNQYPTSKNLLLKDLNQQVTFADRVARTALYYGTSETTTAQVKQRVGSFLDAPSIILSFTNYLARAPVIGEIYWQDINLPAHGDGTVAIQSLEGLFLNDDRVELFPYCAGTCRSGDSATLGKVGHTDIVANVDVQGKILRALGHPLPPSTISTGSGLSGSNLLVPFATYNLIVDPVQAAFLVDSQGRRTGYSPETGQLTEIPGSFFSGNEDGIAWIFSDTPLKLHLELVGAGQNHYVQASGIGPGYGFGVESTGPFNQDENRTLAVTPTSPFPWHNAVRPTDVSGGPFNQPDSNVVAGDVIAIINYINAFKSGPIPDDAFFGFPFGFLDTTGDNNVAADDVIKIINAINAGTEEEGEARMANSQPPLGMDSLLLLLAMDTAEQTRRKRG